MSRTSSKQWVRVVAEIRSTHRALGTACALCRGARGPIDYRTRGEFDRDAKAAGEWWLLGQHRPLSLHVDHVIPYSAGGTDTIDNAAPTHAVCNEQAGAKGSKTTNTKPKPVNGYWIPRDGDGAPLPGRAIPGTSTATHRFVAAADRPTGHPLPAPASSGTPAIADFRQGSEPPRSSKS